MKLTVKNYKIIKIKKYFKLSHFFFVVNGINRDSLDWLLTKQGLETVGFNYYKILNRITTKTLNTSIYLNIKSLTNGSTFFIKPKLNRYLPKQTILSTFNPLFFELLIIKLNNKVYTIDYFKNVYSLKYKETKLLFYQFNLTHLKTSFKFSK